MSTMNDNIETMLKMLHRVIAEDIDLVMIVIKTLEN